MDSGIPSLDVVFGGGFPRNELVTRFVSMGRRFVGFPSGGFYEIAGYEGYGKTVPDPRAVRLRVACPVHRCRAMAWGAWRKWESRDPRCSP